MRARLNDYKVVLVTASRVSHLGAGTMTGENLTLEADRSVLLKTISSVVMQEMLGAMPLEYEAKKYGMLNFNVYTKKEETPQC